MPADLQEWLENNTREATSVRIRVGERANPSTVACIIDRAYPRAAAFALAGGALTFFGFMHSEAIGIGRSPTVACGYLLVAGALFALSRQTAPRPVGVGAVVRHDPIAALQALSHRRSRRSVGHARPWPA